MSSFDYNAPAELFLSKPAKGCRKSIAVSRLRLRRSVMPLRTYASPRPFDAWLEVGEERFSSSEIHRLYEADVYLLRKSE
jgi:hypothetical protein